MPARGATVAAAAGIAGAAVILLWALVPGGEGAPPAGTAAPSSARRPDGPAAPAAGGASVSGSADTETDPGVVSTGPRRVEPTAELREGLTAFRAATAKAMTPPRTPAQALAAARERGVDTDPVAYRLELEAILRRDPSRAAEVARMLAQDMGEQDGPLLFQTALALAPRLDEEATAVLLDASKSAGPAARPHVVFALRGSDAPEVDHALAGLYEKDEAPDVRGQAAFVLAERMERLAPPERARVLATARAGIAGDDPRARTAAADVLGGAELAEPDRALLKRIVREGGDHDRRMAALRALATAGASVDDLRGELAAIAADPAAPEELRALARRLTGSD